MKTLFVLLFVSLGFSRLSAAESEKATFAAGCFWCMQGIYERVPGVTKVVAGYCGGKMQNPTYHDHGDHAESVDVTFDPTKVSYDKLLRIYWRSFDPTDESGVAPDFGRSYRPILFYRTPEQLATIEKVKAEIQKRYTKPIATEIVPFEKFWPGEDYHQDYVRKHPDNYYVRAVSLPRIRRALGHE